MRFVLVTLVAASFSRVTSVAIHFLFCYSGFRTTWDAPAEAENQCGTNLFQAALTILFSNLCRTDYWSSQLVSLLEYGSSKSRLESGPKVFFSLSTVACGVVVNMVWSFAAKMYVESRGSSKFRAFGLCQISLVRAYSIMPFRAASESPQTL